MRSMALRSRYRTGEKQFFPAPVRPRRDVGHRAVLLDLPANGVAVVTLVAMQDASGRHLLQQDCPGGAISDLPAGEQEGDGPTVAIGQRVDLGRASAARAADGLAALPSFPPEAERCAFTAELSISTWAGGPPAFAKAWKRSTHTPLAAQRT